MPPGNVIEFKPSQAAQENPEQAAKHDQEQQAANEFAAAQIDQAPGSNFKVAAPEASPVPTAADIIEKQRNVDPATANSEEQIQKLTAELEAAPDKIVVLNRWMRGVQSKQIDPGDVLEAQARATKPLN